MMDHDNDLNAWGNFTIVNDYWDDFISTKYMTTLHGMDMTNLHGMGGC